MLQLLPIPKSVVEHQELCKLDGLSILVAPGQDGRIYDAALTLRKELRAVVGWTPVLRTAEAEGHCIAVTTRGQEGEGYTLSVTAAGITVEGEGPAGTFYAIQTLRQLLQGAKNCGLQGVTITDRPDFAMRGIYHDVTRGKVPTLDTLKELVDRLAYYKINMLQLYIEDAFAFAEYEGVMQPYEVLTPEEIRQLDAYCYDRFVELVPSISTFGHLYRLLQSPRYKHLCEYEDYQPTTHPWIEKMRHHTIDVSNPQSIQVIHSMIDQYVGLCRSPYFNICCDETFDLCKGKNAGRDVGEAYFDFVNQIIGRVKYHGKQVMMWGDIVLQHPEKVQQLPADTVMLNWNYSAQPPEKGAIAFEQAGVRQVVCPGTISWNRWLAHVDSAKSNITGMAQHGQNHGAMGLLTTNWGDFGNVCSLDGSWYGLTMGAQAGWHLAAPTEEDYELIVSQLAYGQQVNVIPYLRQLNRCENAAPWGPLVDYVGRRDLGDTTVTVSGDPTGIQNTLNECLQLQEDLTALATTPPMEDVKRSAQAIELMVRCYLYCLGAAEKPDVEPFLATHREAWLLKNKQSQLTWVEDLFRRL